MRKHKLPTPNELSDFVRNVLNPACQYYGRNCSDLWKAIRARTVSSEQKSNLKIINQLWAISPPQKKQSKVEAFTELLKYEDTIGALREFYNLYKKVIEKQLGPDDQRAELQIIFDKYYFTDPENENQISYLIRDPGDLSSPNNSKGNGPWRAALTALGYIYHDKYSYRTVEKALQKAGMWGTIQKELGVPQRKKISK